MESKLEQQLVLWPAADLNLRLERVRRLMSEAGLEAVLLSDNTNAFYITGRVIRGYIYIEATGRTLYFVRRPAGLLGENIHQIRKPEDITAILGDTAAHVIGLELDSMPYSMVERLRKVFPNSEIGNASPVLRRARAVKTPLEISLITESGVKQTEAYRRIPHLYQEGMTDIEFQIEIERELRLGGCLGQFRVSGDDMEIYMGNVLTGDNADAPSPYDFAMGGAGASPSLPVGADGSIIRPNAVVMVDVNGNFNGYMTDMTRCYSAGEPTAEAVKANSLSISICHAVANAAVAGAAASDLYKMAVAMAEEAGMAQYFMGHRYQAGFIGHGLGITINEAPVLAPRSRDVLEAGNVIAVEPKFVIPGIGAVGVENTFVVQPSGPAKCLTLAPEEIVNLQ